MRKMIDDRELALLELRLDPLFEKIPSEKVQYYIQNSLNFGREAAKKYKEEDTKSLFSENKIKLTYNDSGNFVMDFQLRAEYVQKDDQNEVILYRDSLKQLVNSWNHSELTDVSITYEEVEAIHLAHEFYHFLEYTSLSPTEKQLDPVIIKVLFGREKKRSIRQCSEIAGHAFAKELTGFPYFPTLLDLIYLQENGELDQDVANEVFYSHYTF